MRAIFWWAVIPEVFMAALVISGCRALVYVSGTAPGAVPVGLLLNFTSAIEKYNNIGGQPAVPLAGCLANAKNLPVPGTYEEKASCPCGCGCRCPAPPTGQPREMRYEKAGRLHEANGLTSDLDIVITNTSRYVPWTTNENLKTINGGNLAQISLLYDTGASFKFQFRDTATDTPKVINYGARAAATRPRPPTDPLATPAPALPPLVTAFPLLTPRRACCHSLRLLLARLRQRPAVGRWRGRGRQLGDGGGVRRG